MFDNTDRFIHDTLLVPTMVPLGTGDCRKTILTARWIFPPWVKAFIDCVLGRVEGRLTTTPPPALPRSNTFTSIKTRCRPPADNLLTPTSQVPPLRLSPTSWSIGWCHGWVMPPSQTHTYTRLNLLINKQTEMEGKCAGDCPVHSLLSYCLLYAVTHQYTI